MSANYKNCVILLTGIDKDFDRVKLREEFSQFGDVSKIYVQQEGKYAKVYFSNPTHCHQAYTNLKTNPFMWKLYYREDRIEFLNLEKDIINGVSSNLQALQNTLITNNRKIKMYDSNNLYSEGEAQLNDEYCNIHGEPLDVFESDMGDLFINLKDIARTGFSIFRRDTFHSLRISPNQITQEFECFLLSEAAKYILQNRAHSIDEEMILRTIENVKRKLIGSAAGENKSHYQNQHILRHQIDFRSQPDFRNSYGARNQFEFRNQRDSRNQSNNRNWLDSRNQQEFRNWSTVDNRLHHIDSKNQFQNNRNQLPDDGSGSESRSRSRSRGRKQENPISDVSSSPFGDMQKSMHQTPRLPRNFPQRNSSTKDEKRDTTNLSNNLDIESLQSTTTINITDEIRKPKIPSSNSSTSSEIRSPIPCEKIEKFRFDIGNIYEVKICYPESEKENICWVHEKQSMNQLQDLMFQICELEPSLEPLKTFNKGQLVLGLYEEVWWRAQVVDTNSNLVHFLDYGNKSPAEALKPLPDNFKKTPTFAVRLVVNSVKISLEEGKEFFVKVNKKYDDDTYLVDAIEDNSALPKEQNDLETNRQPSVKIESTYTHSSRASVIKNKPVQMIEKQFEVVEKAQTEVKEVVDFNIPQPSTTVKHKDKSAQITEKKFEVVVKPQIEIKDAVYFDIPKPVTTVKPGDVVVIVERLGEKLYLKTKECIDKGKEINTHIKELDKSELVMNTVKEGQLVLCSREGWVSMFRAVITEKQDSLVVKVRYLDVSGTDTVSVKSLRNVDEYLSKQPALMLSTPDLSYLNDISIAGNNHIAEIIQRKEKLTVEYSNNQIDFRQENGELLSMTLSAFKKPAPKQNATATVDEQCFYDDMPYIELEPGVHDFICYSVKGASDITLVLQRDDVIEQLNLLIDLKSDNDNPYKPELCEICLVYDDKDDLWYRAVVYEIEDDKYVVYTVDFGMEMSVESDKLRSFPNHLKKVPIIGIGCELAGFPDTPKMTEKIRSIIKEGESLTVNVLKLSDETQKYLIEVPGLKEELNKVD